MIRIMFWASLAPVRPQQLRLRQHMALHRGLKLRLRRAWGKRQRRIEGVQLEVIPMRAAGRTRAAVAEAAEVGQALPHASRQFLVGGTASGRLLADGGMLYATQWTQMRPGASGSSLMRATLFVPAGGSPHASGGETSLSSHV